MLPLDRPLLDEITLAAAGVALIAFILVLVALVKLRRLRSSFQTLEGPEGRETVLQSIGRAQSETAAMRAELVTARQQVGAAQADLAAALRHVAVVRYDAFGDMGGRMSFSAALLDDAGDGLVLTAINGRTEGRSYAKGVHSGKGDPALSPEEEQAVHLALRNVTPAGGGTSAGSVPTAAASADAERS